MRLSRLRNIFIITSACLLILQPVTQIFAADDAMNMFQNSDFIEKEQPELTEETKQLISIYHKNPTEENYNNLRNEVIKNYDAVLERKEAKLAELKEETAGKPGGEEKVAEMQDIVDEMYATYWDRINSNMLRFTDSRLLSWNTANASAYDYIPVMGAGENIYISRTTVTNSQYAEYINATGAAAPGNWTDGTYPAGEDDYPVNYVSYYDAVNYCKWLTSLDRVNSYRLPTEAEWELAAGHMPKDADFNCGVNDGRTPVYQYEGITRGAHGAIDFWGNVWEWTSTVCPVSDNSSILEVKGGAWNSDRTDCRTEYRDEGRDESLSYDDVGFRVIQVLNGYENSKEPDVGSSYTPGNNLTENESDIPADSDIISAENPTGSLADSSIDIAETTSESSFAESSVKNEITTDNASLASPKTGYNNKKLIIIISCMTIMIICGGTGISIYIRNKIR